MKIAILEERLVVENQPPCLQGSLLIIIVVKNKNRKQLIARHCASLWFPKFLVL